MLFHLKLRMDCFQDEELRVYFQLQELAFQKLELVQVRAILRAML